MFLLSFIFLAWYLLIISDLSGCSCSSHFVKEDIQHKENEQKENMIIDYSEATSSKYRFILYDVNQGEGFNLRRDVYMRMASLVKKLGSEYKLVLPLWLDLPHWKKKRIRKKASPERVDERWSIYFDVDSLNNYLPVIEYHNFLRIKDTVDVILALQYFSDTEWQRI